MSASKNNANDKSADRRMNCSCTKSEDANTSKSSHTGAQGSSSEHRENKCHCTKASTKPNCKIKAKKENVTEIYTKCPFQESNRIYDRLLYGSKSNRFWNRPIAEFGDAWTKPVTLEHICRCGGPTRHTSPDFYGQTPGIPVRNNSHSVWDHQPEACFIDSFGAPVSTDCGEILVCKYTSSTLIRPRMFYDYADISRKGDYHNPFDNLDQRQYISSNVNFGPCQHQPYYFHSVPSNLSKISCESIGGYKFFTGSQNSECNCHLKSKQVCKKKQTPLESCCGLHIVCEPKRKIKSKCNKREKSEIIHQCIVVKDKSLQCDIAEIKPRKRSCNICNPCNDCKPCKPSKPCSPCSPCSPCTLCRKTSFIPIEPAANCTTRQTCQKNKCIPKTSSGFRFSIKAPFSKIAKCCSKTFCNSATNKGHCTKAMTLNDCCKNRSRSKVRSLKRTFTFVADPLPSCSSPSQESIYNKYNNLLKNMSLTMSLK